MVVESSEREASGGGRHRPYTREELRRVAALFHRISHLIERTRGKPHLTYDLQEISAILWTVEELVEWRGPFPDDLMLVLASLRKDVPRKPSTPNTEPGSTT